MTLCADCGKEHYRITHTGVAVLIPETIKGCPAFKRVATSRINPETAMRKRIIVCAANRFPDGTVLLGARHWDSHMLAMADRLGISGGDEEQGFIDQYGDFHDRESALSVIKESGQNFDPKENGCNDILFSEGLY